MNFEQLATGIIGTAFVFALGMGCALALGSICLSAILGLMTCGQYNVNDCRRNSSRSSESAR